jgi:hypothetical protein
MQSRRTSSKVLYSSAFVLVLAAWYVVLHDPIYRGALARLAGATPYNRSLRLEDYSAYEAKDPPLNSPFPSKGVGQAILAKTRRNSKGYLVAAMGDCKGCTSLDLGKLYSQTRERGITLLAFSDGDRDRVRTFEAGYRREGLDIPVYYDLDRRLATTLNAYYGGRLYYFTSDWKLGWRERDGQIDNYLFRTGRFDRLMANVGVKQ